MYQLFAACRREEEYILLNILFSFFSITLNIGSYPIIILMNMLVTIAIKTRLRLRCEYNILLACLAGTDSFGGGCSFKAIIYRKRNLLSVGCIAVG